MTSRLVSVNIGTAYYFFLFFSTIFIYSLHRIVGIEMVGIYRKQGRYKIIKQYKHHIRVYAIIGLAGAIYYYFKLPYRTCILLLAPAVISVIYTVPLLPHRRRIRDFHYIKIILISIVWGLLTVLIPFDTQLALGANDYLLFIERTLFIFAITIPFDIRDELVDKRSSVKTLIHSLGIKISKRLALFFILISFIIYIFLFFQLHFDWKYIIAIFISYSLSSVLIIKANADNSDYYFSGLLDGTMILLLIGFLAAEII